VTALACTVGANTASAENTVINQNISGFNLPGVTLPQGHDEVRAADGTTCRSAVSGSGAYLDVGVIGNPEQDTTAASFSAYGRLVVPLGVRGSRLDCSVLYDLEVQRLALELKLSQMGLNRGIAPVSEEISTNPSTDITKLAEAANEEDATEEATKKIASLKSEEKSAAKAVKNAPAKKIVKTDNWADEDWTTEGLEN
jgi:hypothetical protein